MTDNVTDITSTYYQNFAKKFVDLYEENPIKAGLYAVETVDKDKLVDAKPYVDIEFQNRGYNLNDI